MHEPPVFAEVDSAWCGRIPDVAKTRIAVTPDGWVSTPYMLTVETDQLQRDIVDLLLGRTDAPRTQGL